MLLFRKKVETVFDKFLTKITQIPSVAHRRSFPENHHMYGCRRVLQSSSMIIKSEKMNVSERVDIIRTKKFWDRVPRKKVVAILVLDFFSKFADFWILVRVSLIGFIRETPTKIQKSANQKKVSTFFRKSKISSRKMKKCRSFFFSEQINISEIRLARVLERTTPIIKIKKKVAEKVGEIPKRKLTGVLRPRDLPLENNYF